MTLTLLFTVVASAEMAGAAMDGQDMFLNFTLQIIAFAFRNFCQALLPDPDIPRHSS